jgi:hypothetical protein
MVPDTSEVNLGTYMYIDCVYNKEIFIWSQTILDTFTTKKK